VPEDKTLLQVVRAAREVGDLDAVLEATVTLQEAYPRRALIPRALWDRAEIQKKSGWQDDAMDTLERLIERYPVDPLAEQARRLLAVNRN